MSRPGLALVLPAILFGVVGCHVGAPERASDIQNLNGINDDISAVTMTRSDSSHPEDPNAHTTLPNHYQINDTR
ncbi:MAG TPA: hypothetical protein VFA12_14560 [Stellaceae bacterium]|nr:hypothetical protein [Stellaceae bacterium]